MADSEIKIVMILHNDQIARVTRENTHFSIVEYEANGETVVEVVSNEDLLLIDVIPIRRF